MELARRQPAGRLWCPTRCARCATGPRARRATPRRGVQAWAAAGGELRPAIDLATWLAAAGSPFAQAPPRPVSLAGLGFIQQAVPAGDLDGDGIDDVLATGQLYDEERPPPTRCPARTATSSGGSRARASPTRRSCRWRTARCSSATLRARAQRLRRPLRRGRRLRRRPARRRSPGRVSRTRRRDRRPALGAALRGHRRTRSYTQTQDGEQAYASQQVERRHADQDVVVLPGPDLDGDGAGRGAGVARATCTASTQRQLRVRLRTTAGRPATRSRCCATIIAEVLSGATGRDRSPAACSRTSPATAILRDAGDLDGDGTARPPARAARAAALCRHDAAPAPVVSTATDRRAAAPGARAPGRSDARRRSWRAVAPDTQDVGAARACAPTSTATAGWTCW